MLLQDAFLDRQRFLRPVQTKFRIFFLHNFFLLTPMNCNPFWTGIWGIIFFEMPVKSVLLSDEIVKTLAPFEFEMIDEEACIFYYSSVDFPKKFIQE